MQNKAKLRLYGAGPLSTFGYVRGSTWRQPFFGQAAENRDGAGENEGI